MPETLRHIIELNNLTPVIHNNSSSLPRVDLLSGLFHKVVKSFCHHFRNKVSMLGSELSDLSLPADLKVFKLKLEKGNGMLQVK